CLNLHIPTLFEKSTSMQIVPFLTHYQLVYANFDFSSFSLISYCTKYIKLHDNMAQIILPSKINCMDTSDEIQNH
ncbi:MAG: hypothetical protein ACFN0J_10160, partial [Segatella salivae]